MCPMTHYSLSSLELNDDSKLAKMAANGDNEALQQLLVRYEPYIRACSSPNSNIGIEADDLMQEGRLGLISAAQRYQCDGGASFKTYACICIKRQITSAVRHAMCLKNLVMNNYVSLDDEENAVITGFSEKSPEDIVISMESVSAVKKALSSMFSSFERKLFSLYLSGFSYEYMANDLHVNKKHIDNSLQRIKRKLSLLFG